MTLSLVRLENETPKLLTKAELAAKEKRWVKMHREFNSRRVELGKMLIELRAGVEQGEWDSYLEHLCKLVFISRATAYNYVDEATAHDKLKKNILRALTNKGVDLSIRRNIDNAILAQEEFPNLTPDEIAGKVKRAEKPRGQNSHRRTTPEKDVPEEKHPVAEPAAVRTALRANQCMIFVAIHLGKGKYANYSPDERAEAAINLAKLIDKEEFHAGKKESRSQKRLASGNKRSAS